MMKYRKMTNADVTLVLNFLTSAAGSTKLTWRDIEEFSGFTRQALQARVEIKGAYDVAKQSARLARAAEPTEPELYIGTDERLVAELSTLKDRVAQLEYRETLWKRRWYRIAYNIRQQGLQVVDVDKVIPLESQGMTVKQVNALLAPYDDEIPPVSSRQHD